MTLHQNTHEIIRLADAEFESGKVELPIDYIDAHFQEYPDSEKLYYSVQRVYEARCLFIEGINYD